MSHINELIDYTVETFVVFDDKVLLKFHDKYGIWLSVGGHIELDENPNQAAVREVKEEVGLDISLYDKLLSSREKDETYEELIPPYFMNIHKINETHRHVTMVYFAKASTDKIIEPEKEKSGGWEWMTKAEIEQAIDIRPLIKIYALRALDELSGK